MKVEDLRLRIDALLSKGNAQTSPSPHELFQGALSILSAVHGSSCAQIQTLTKAAEQLRERFSGNVVDQELNFLAEGALKNLKAELDAGLAGSLQRTITAEVLTDFIQLSRAALEEDGDSAKNVAAVLASAVYEDTIRRLAITNGIPHIEKLADVLMALKDKGLLQGSQIGIANSYLNFRNNSLHAQWNKVEREAVASVLGFVEQLLLKHF
jgi:hypothetical protein